jgi:5-methylcytosine-specific restriction endonuclease McrA
MASTLENGVSTTEWGSLSCGHAQTAVRWRIRSNGVGTYVAQCLICGRELRSIRHASAEVRSLTERIPFDETLADAWYERCARVQKIRWAATQQQWEAEAAAHEAERRAFYEAHLRSAKWRAIRQRVLDRAHGMCEGCGIHKADHVHHLTYDHLGNEFLFELVAVCYACHCRIHEREIGA